MTTTAINNSQLSIHNSFHYDPSGNLISDTREGLSNIQWTADGKVKSIAKTGNISINFLYDARGDRVAKRVTAPGEDSLTSFTFYLRDANGEVMAIYDTTAPAGRFTPNIAEWLVYGSESHGRFETVKPTERTLYSWQIPSPPDTVYTRKLRFREYELKDHLGNVRVVFSDLKLQPILADTFRLDLLSVNNYFPFGMQEPERNWKATNYKYRFGYNGKEKDNEVKGEANSYDYGARFYDPRLGRFLSLDPKIRDYPNYSPYSSFDNNPIYFIDPDGNDAKISIKGKNITVTTNIQIYGCSASNAKANEIEKSIMKDWGNKKFSYKDKNGKPYNIKFAVNVSLYANGTEGPGKQKGEKLGLSTRNPDDPNDINYVRITDKKEELSSKESGATYISYVINGQVGSWLSNDVKVDGRTKDASDTWSHEFGHLLGLPDGYYDIPPPLNFNGEGWTVGNYTGWEKSIMAKPNTGFVDQFTIDKLVPAILEQSNGKNNYIYDSQKSEISTEPIKK